MLRFHFFVFQIPIDVPDMPNIRALALDVDKIEGSMIEVNVSLTATSRVKCKRISCGGTEHTMQWGCALLSFYVAASFQPKAALVNARVPFAITSATLLHYHITYPPTSRQKANACKLLNLESLRTPRSRGSLSSSQPGQPI